MRSVFISVSIVVTCILLASLVLAYGQQVLRMEDQSYRQKTTFLRGEQLFVVVVFPSTVTVDVLVHYPPNSPGPSPKTLVSGAVVQGKVESRLGPIILEQNAPCGKYQVEVKVVNPPGGQLFTFFDYATNEPPCAVIVPPSPPPTSDLLLVAFGSIAAIVIVAAVALILQRRRLEAAPPKAPAVPLSPPASPPAAARGPPKEPSVTPRIRKVEEDVG